MLCYMIDLMEMFRQFIHIRFDTVKLTNNNHTQL